MKTALSIIQAVFALSLHSAVLAQTASKIDGLIYADYYYNYKNSVPAEKDRNAFQFRRIYFTYENNITEAIKVRFRLESENGNYGSTSKINPFVKHAYLEWSNLIPQHKLYFGIEETNAFKNSEEYWSYRSIEKTILDLNKICSSADMGLALRGDFNRFVHHWLTVMNGTGYGASEGDRFKKIGYALWLTPVRGLILEGYMDYEKQDPNAPQTATVMSAGKDYNGSTGYLTWKVFLGYDHPHYTIGAEYFQRTNQNSGIERVIITDGKLASYSKADVVKLGYSVFTSWITPLSRLKIFARYDFYDPNCREIVFTKFSDGQLAGSGRDDESALVIAGLDYIPAANVHIMPNIFCRSYADAERKNDITGRVTLYIKYDSGKITGE